MADKNYEELFAKLRVNFLFNHPFLSVLALSIPTTFEQNTNSAFQTNGAKITIDLKKLDKYSDENITYLYAHTLLHIVLKHPYRQKTRDTNIWNMSCDLVINNILDTFENIGVKPNDEIIDLDMVDKCVEEVYEILYKQDEDEQNQDSQRDEKQEAQAKVSPDPKGDKEAYIYNESKRDLEEVADEKTSQGDQEKLDGIIIQALTIAKKTSHKYGGLQIEIDTLIRPQISLQDVLKEYLTASLFEKQTTFSRPNKRYIHTGLYLPGTKKSDEFIEVYIALDSSSSVSLEEYKKFLGIIQDVCEGFYEYKVTILPFDKYVKSEHIISFDSFNPLKEKDLYIPKSDGGTDFDTVLKYLKNTDIRAENLLMVLSDGEFEITQSLVSKTLFIISEKKNLKKFENYGRVIEFSM
jgi:predicted metal-dependent peptidase